MFGISPPGWVHTLGSLPAVPAAAYMFIKNGRITPRTRAGAVYFFAMLIGGLSVFLVAKQPISNLIGAITLALLLVGYGVRYVPSIGRAAVYVEIISLTLTAFLLAVPSVTETLRRVPDGHPWVTDPKSPVLLATQGTLVIALIIGVVAQLYCIRRQ